MGIKWEGTAVLKALCKGAEKRVETQLQQVIKKHTAKLHQREVRKAPRKTGFLRDSIAIDITPDGLTGIVQPLADYAAYLEYGTRLMIEPDSYPFVRPAYEETAKEFQDDMKNLNLWT